MSHQQKQQQFDGNDEDNEEDIRSIGGSSEWSMDTIGGDGNAKQNEEENNPKIALLEVNL
jgi:hypothetical protein